MVTAHFLTPGFTTAGGTTLLTPVYRFANALERAGIAWRVFHSPTRDAGSKPQRREAFQWDDGLVECDVLVVDGDTFRGVEQSRVIEELGRLRERVGRLVWYDTEVSTGLPNPWVLRHVDFYWKGQALKDRNLYLRPMYGGRYFTDYYHRWLGIEDKEPVVWPGVDDVMLVRKIKVAWNAAFVDPFQLVPAWAGPSRGNGATPYVRPPGRAIEPSMERGVGVSARLGRDYPQATLAYQRERIRQMIGRQYPTETVDRAEYLEEIQDAMVVLAPFGIGEITPRDFETFLSGALLVKPVMNIVDTWPALYTENFTFWTINWRMDHLDYLVQGLLDEYHKVVEVAALGQQRYMDAVKGRRAAALFARRLHSLLTAPA